jgi:hypothetical protein
MEVVNINIEPKDGPLLAPVTITLDLDAKQHIPEMRWAITLVLDVIERRHTIVLKEEVHGPTESGPTTFTFTADLQALKGTAVA